MSVEAVCVCHARMHTHTHHNQVTSRSLNPRMIAYITVLYMWYCSYVACLNTALISVGKKIGFTACLDRPFGLLEFES